MADGEAHAGLGKELDGLGEASESDSESVWISGRG